MNRVGNLFPPAEVPSVPRSGQRNVKIPHFAFPFTVGVDGNFGVLEQDSAEEIINCVELISSVPKGGLVDEPEFGITDPTFMIVPPTSLIQAQVREWEFRAQITAVEAPPGEDMTLANIIVRVQTGNIRA